MLCGGSITGRSGCGGSYHREKWEVLCGGSYHREKWEVLCGGSYHREKWEVLGLGLRLGLKLTCTTSRAHVHAQEG